VVNVNAIEGIKYGFRLMGYVVAVAVIGAGMMSMGGVMVDGDSPVIGGLVALVGFLVFYAGFLGVAYKVIADAVEQGVRAAGQTPTGPSGNQQRGNANARQGTRSSQR